MTERNKTKAGLFTFLLVLAILAVGCIIGTTHSRGEDAKQVTKNLVAHYDNGDTRNITVSYPEYASIHISQHHGGHSLTTWEYCMFKGVMRCQKTLVNGVQWIEYR